MPKSARTKPSAEVRALSQLMIPLAAVIRSDLREFVITCGLEALAQMLEKEREQLCGPSHRRGQARRNRRAGSAPGRLVMGGRRVMARRPRVRNDDGEVRLASWDELAQTDPLEERAYEQMILGVATRGYARSLEPVPEELSEHGTSRSAVSRRFKAATKKQVQALLSRDLSALPIAAVLIDGLHVANHVILVALGVEEGGKKQVLGVWEGATENLAACRGLLTNLIERGLSVSKSHLLIIDGRKALAKAVREVFGSRTLIQRCQMG